MRYLLAACFIIAVSLYAICTHYLDKFYRQQIPAEVEVAGLVYADNGIRGSCGAAIFELAPRSKARLNMLGMRALTETGPGNVYGPDPGISEYWQETPYIYENNESPGENYWALTLSCTWLDAETHKNILGALGRPGAFFRRHKQGVTLVVPSADMVAYFFFD